MRAGLDGAEIDIVFTDVPYGQHSEWQAAGTADPARAMLEALHSVLNPESIVAVASDKSQKIAHEGYRRLEKLQSGKRLVVILKPTF